jgi:hypothetical protein
LPYGCWGSARCFLILLVAVISQLTPYFLAQTAVIAIVAIGQHLVI